MGYSRTCNRNLNFEIMEKLTFKEKLIVFFGFGYVVNESSKEIHRLSRKHKNCLYNMMGKKKYTTREGAYRLIFEDGYNGCRYCWNEMDSDE